ncbi:MAG TPA: RNA polymerase sigma factor [Gemmatales bacterium]|nr:RNA polymerase sigma factor [Gemmatales bacterium]HMP58544.1 RNA polymerase sigma factor [Gemmatales bacterium]
MSRTCVTAGETPPRPDEAPAPADLLVDAFNQMRDELIGTLYYLLGNRDDAHDAAQEAFMKCWRARTSLGDVVNLRAWIFRVAMNAATDFQRSAWKRKARPLAEGEAMHPSTSPPAGAALEHQEELDRLQAALMHLRQEEKEIFLLRQNGELTYEAIAELKHLPVGTVKTQMRSALQKLRKALG